jgi:molybdate transport system regulatory protein
VEKQQQDAVVRVHIWMERGGETLFGLGRIQLLERIDACGSIKGAADMLGMSYRAAWGKIRASEEVLGVALVEKLGGNKSGCHLTPEGQALAEAFRTWFREVERHAVAQANTLFPFLCRNFPDKKNHAHPAEDRSYVFQNI